ncbi:short-chain collagen C4-like isoform X1 [Pomacea canaliculata]|uniref:short-chain collagen C4-like isoform X1 n=1 Tax=Pomacea canaliculata TaxID=400727 RepID=UPI000D73744C|nr:short-chain collagen C4-like isoform X1 [Pomacea canaliculata]
MLSSMIIVLALMIMHNEDVVASSDVNRTQEQDVSSLLSVTSEEETRRLRRLEAEVEILRRSVTELKAAGPCAKQQSSLEADALSVAQEVRGLRHHVQAMRMYSELSAIRSEVQSLRSRLPGNLTGEIKPPAAVPDMNEPIAEVSGRSSGKLPGSVYTRWGNSQCPSDAQLVYSGVIGGSFYTNEGAASNSLCLPLNPVFNDYVLPGAVTYIYGAEYEVNPLPSHDLEPKCSVCHIARAATVMMPATNSCHTGWTMEYSGFLMAGHHTHKAATEFTCVDTALEGMIGTKDNREGYLFYMVVTSCGSLPCPPYIANKGLSCVVCSK